LVWKNEGKVDKYLTMTFAYCSPFHSILFLWHGSTATRTETRRKLSGGDSELIGHKEFTPDDSWVDGEGGGAGVSPGVKLPLREVGSGAKAASSLWVRSQHAGSALLNKGRVAGRLPRG
jgi:hypothetical protein